MIFNQFTKISRAVADGWTDWLYSPSDPVIPPTGTLKLVKNGDNVEITADLQITGMTTTSSGQQFSQLYLVTYENELYQGGPQERLVVTSSLYTYPLDVKIPTTVTSYNVQNAKVTVPYSVIKNKKIALYSIIYRSGAYPWNVLYRVSGNPLVTDNSFNSSPTVVLTSPTPNQTLHENSTLNLAGSTTDMDIDNIVTVKYQIDSGTVRNLHSAVSDGTTPINFSKSLTYKDGMLYDGATAVTSKLDKDVPHTVSMWTEDDKGGKSPIITRTFFVVPNRPPGLTIQPIAAQSDLINSNIINVVGTVTDLDNNDVTATFSINGAEEQVIFEGAARNFTFNILLNDLKVGANTVIVKVVDTYNAVTTKTLTINKTHNATPINEAVALYQVSAPTGTAKSILLWITRTLGPLQITPEISFTNAGEPENFVPLELTNSGTVNGLKQDEYAYQGAEDKANIVLKITYNRNDVASLDAIKQISGVLF